MKAFFAVGVLVILGSAACSGNAKEPTSGPSTSSSGGSGDGGSGSSSGDIGGGDSGSASTSECKGFAPTGDEVALTSVSGEPDPTATGGTIADGTYQLTSVTVYNGPAETALVKIKTTLRIKGSTWVRGHSFRTAIGDAGGAASVGSDSGTFTVSGASLGAVTTCDDGEDDKGFGGFLGELTATDTKLTLVQDAPSGVQGATKIKYVLDKQ